MLVFPNAKINLGLQVTAKRADGYHDIATIFYPLPITDMLEVVRAADFSFTQTGLPTNIDPALNLCVKAWNLLRDAYQLPPVAMHLHKQIPMGAGLGGGSADAAFTLRLVNQIFQLNLSTDTLLSYALQLGSDCPFFLLNSPAFAEGRGEQLTSINIPSLRGKTLVLINPGIHISTAWAFAQVQPAPANVQLIDIIQLPVSAWKGQLPNDFEKPVMAAHPELETIRNSLYSTGALFAGMTGTGSTLFGIFETALNNKLTWPAHYQQWQVAL